jgi:Domain of unknown function (DUF4440)
MRRILIPLLVGIVLVPMIGRRVADQNEASTVEETKKEVLNFEDGRNQAILKRDTAVFDRMYADEITWTMSNGDLLNRTQVLANIGSENQRLFTTQHSDRRLHLFGNAVSSAGSSNSSERYVEKMITMPRRFTNVYVKQNVQWKLVVHTVTPPCGPWHTKSSRSRTEVRELSVCCARVLV